MRKDEKTRHFQELIHEPRKMSSKQPTVEDSSPPRETQGSLIHTEEGDLFNLPHGEDAGEKTMAVGDGQQPLEQVNQSIDCINL